MRFDDPFTSDSSRKTSDSSGISQYLRVSAFAGHRDTLARVRFNHPPVPWLPDTAAYRIFNELSFSDYKALRLTCRRWAESLPQPHFPAAYRMPAEVIQQIYCYLLPSEFDAARHTCRSWLEASLDPRLQRLMFRRAACWEAAQADLALHEARLLRRDQTFDETSSADHGDIDIQDCHSPELEEVISVEWLYSSRLATECKLSAEWKGTGLRTTTSELRAFGDRFYVTNEVDFSRQIVAHASISRAANSFNVSACGKFLLLVNQQDVTIYQLSEEYSPELLTRLSCGRDVLAVSMDTSSGRHTVAVLLDDRVGMCWDLDQIDAELDRNSTLPPNPDALPSNLEEITKVLRTSVPTLTVAMHPPGSADRRLWTQTTAAFQPRGISQPVGSPTTIYENIGSPDDSPRSVALCPQRRCVAFGCRFGIELHWVDALAGGDLNRWFPLAAPSDYLYFLPQREGDSTNKLRLISSSSGPISPAMSTRSGSPSYDTWDSAAAATENGRRRSMTRLFFGSLPFPCAVRPGIWRNSAGTMSSLEDRHGIIRTVDCDHYRAVPLSDGVHVLFTDPETNIVCMGSDAPLGGPTKLLRKAVLIAPVSHGTRLPPTTPSLPLCYTAGSDLKWGVRIVVAYNNGSVVLYNIPSDVFEKIRHLRSTPSIWEELSGFIAESDIAMDRVMDRWTHDVRQLAHANASTEPQAGNDAAASHEAGSSPFATSLQISGVVVFSNEDRSDFVEDLVVDSRFGGVKIWAFMSSGMARLWDLYMKREQSVSRRWTRADGVVTSEQERVNDQEPEPVHTASKGKAAAKGEQHVHFAGLDGVQEEEVASGPLEVEILTDWRGGQLFVPYVVLL